MIAQRIRSCCTIAVSGLALATCSKPDLVIVGPPPTPTRVAFVVQPTNAVRDTAFAAAIQVQVLDQTGAPLTSATNAITLSLGLNPGHATLAGITTVSAVAGTAAFPGVKLDSVGSGYTLIATAGSLTSDTSAAFNVTLSLADVDGDGLSPNAGDCNDTRADIHPGATDYPDSAFTDANCDGMDGERSNATFVRFNGADSTGCGPQAAPCQTITAGMARAIAGGKRDVYVAAGAYAGFTVADGINVFGGFDASWGRGPGDVVTVTGHQQAVAGLPDSMAVTVLASGLTKATTLADLTLVGAAALGTDSSGAGRNSYVVLALNVTGPGLNVTRDHVIGGPGAAGAFGAPGVDADTLTADSAMFGGIGAAAFDTSVACDNVRYGAGGSAGTPQGASTGSSRTPGKGGHGGTMDTQCSCCAYDFTATPGTSGDSGVQFDGTHGIGGSGGSGSGSCGPAGDGAPGLVTNGSGGPLATRLDTLIGGVWRGLRGQDGQVGDNGGGGGGGGGSGGCDNGTDSYGGGGGGGGAGGARAKAGGGGGGPGGGSFGVYLIDASVTVTHSSIVGGVGGKGGDAGQGGQGQSGGAGGAGGAKASNGSAPGKGGDGGHGGHGGGGAGGNGGASYMILVATPASNLVLTTTMFSLGQAGSGGSGGQSAPNAPAAQRDGNSGQPGSPGATAVVGGYTASARRY